MEGKQRKQTLEELKAFMSWLLTPYSINAPNMMESGRKFSSFPQQILSYSELLEKAETSQFISLPLSFIPTHLQVCVVTYRTSHNTQ